MNIRPYPKNAKKHPQEQIEKIAASIKRFGMNQPIVVDKDGVIIVGHGRFEALKHLGYAMRPEFYKVRDDLTEEEVAAYRLADNKLNESDWDKDLLLPELKGLSDELFDLTGFDRDLLVSKDEKDDEVPSIPTESQTEYGDLYELGGHRIMCGDSLRFESWERLMNERHADMLLTDPPYNVDYEGKTKDALKIDNDSMEDEAFATFLRESFILSADALKPGAVFYIWHADSEGYTFRKAVWEAGLTVRQCLIWVKNTMVLGRQDYQWKHEPCLYGWKDGAAHLWNADRKQTTVLNFDKPSRSAEHPTMKPVELITYQLTNNTKGEDIVLDPFLGSGTTLIAAEKTGRYCYGLELDPKYVDVCISRWVGYTGINEVKKNGETIIWTTSQQNQP